MITSLSVSSIQTLVSTSADGSVRVWDVQSGQTTRSFEKHKGPVAGAVLLPNANSRDFGPSFNMSCAQPLKKTLAPRLTAGESFFFLISLFMCFVYRKQMLSYHRVVVRSP